MDFTFGIITNGANDNIQLIIESIYRLNIPDYEIIIVGGSKIVGKKIIHIAFNEKLKSNWITRKKNIICENASYENIVLLHDYVSFCEDWYTGFLKFGTNFDICVTKIKNKDNTRFRDYTIFPYGNEVPFSKRTLIPYGYPSSLKLSKILYVSGSFYIIKKWLAIKFPLDERLGWNDGEDVLLTKQLVQNNYIIKCNHYSTVQFIKQKGPQAWELEITPLEISTIEKMSNTEIDSINKAQINELKRYIFERTQINIDCV